MNKLEINKESRGDEIVLKCVGRLDANWAGHLNDYIDGLVRDGHYHISTDMTGIEYLSSAGIRSLVSQYKNLKKVNGHFCIHAMSENVNEVLNMVGMLDMLSEKAQKPGVAATPQQQLNAHGFAYSVTKLAGQTPADVSVYGDPAKSANATFTADDARLFQSAENHFAIGLGAIGDDFESCKNRFGEYIMLGKSIAYLPADGSKKPDYMVSSGKLVAALTELYGLHFKGAFSHLVRFDSDQKDQAIALSDLVYDLQGVTGYKQFALVMLAESAGLIGTSLNASPVDGKQLFDYPQVKGTFNFTTEPAHPKMLTLSVGCFASDQKREWGHFLRPLSPAAKCFGHMHSAVFPYVPLKKREIDLSETVSALFNTSELLDVLHLMNDSREIVGLGESQLSQGFCWIVPLG